MPELSQLTSLLTNRDLDRLARLRLKVSRRFTNRGRGEHLGVKGGTSTEFCDYRDYAPGDDVRFVDWNIFARIQRPYLKQFHQEEELHVALHIDATRSMLFEDKLPLAPRFAAALGVLGFHQTASHPAAAAVRRASCSPFSKTSRAAAGRPSIAASRIFCAGTAGAGRR